MDAKKVKLPEGVTVPAKHSTDGKTMLTEITINSPTNAQLFDYGTPVKVQPNGTILPDMTVVQNYLADLIDTPIEELRKLPIEVGMQCTDALLGFLGLQDGDQKSTAST